MDATKIAPKLADVLADETSKGAEARDQLPNRIKRYGLAKAKALAIADYISQSAPHHNDQAQQILDCGNFLLFRDYYTVNEVRLTKASFCKKHLLCPLCAIRRGSKMLGRYIDRFDEIKAANDRLRPYLVTFTVKDGEDLAERFNHLRKNLQSYHKRRHGKKHICEAKKAKAAVWSYEIKRGKNSGLWHPHVHAIWLCEESPDQVTISDQWKNLTGDSYIVDVRPIDESDTAGGFMEVFKYAIKFSDQPHEDTVHCFDILRKKRLIGSFGDFYGIPEPDVLSDDPLEDLPYYEYFFRYLRSTNSYTESSINHHACRA